MYNIRNLWEGFYNNNGNLIHLEGGESSSSHKKSVLGLVFIFTMKWHGRHLYWCFISLPFFLCVTGFSTKVDNSLTNPIFSLDIFGSITKTCQHCFSIENGKAKAIARDSHYCQWNWIMKFEKIQMLCAFKN